MSSSTHPVDPNKTGPYLQMASSEMASTAENAQSDPNPQGQSKDEAEVPGVPVIKQLADHDFKGLLSSDRPNPHGVKLHPAGEFAHLFAGETVSIVVGGQQPLFEGRLIVDVQRFIMPKAVLEYDSDYFRKAFAEGSSEINGGVIKFPEDDPFTFRLFVEVLLSGIPPSRAVGQEAPSSKSPEKEQKRVERNSPSHLVCSASEFLKLYVFAGKLGAEEERSRAQCAFYDIVSLLPAESRCMSPEVIDFTYSHTTPERDGTLRHDICMQLANALDPAHYLVESGEDADVAAAEAAKLKAWSKYKTCLERNDDIMADLAKIWDLDNTVDTLDNDDSGGEDPGNGEDLERVSRRSVDKLRKC